MLELYLDDAGSQTDPQKLFFAIGGYVAPGGIWTSFTRLWQNQLDLKKSLPFHATDCEPGSNGYGHGDFSTWDKDRLLELKKALAPLTLMLSAGVGRGLVVSEHNSALLNDPTLMGRIEGARKYFPLFLLLECTLDWIASEWPGRPKDEKIAVIFETGTTGLPLAASMFLWLRRNMSWANEVFTETLGFGSKSDAELQAADMLAFSVYKDLEGRQLTPPRPERKTLSVLKLHGRLSVKNVAPQDYLVIRDMYSDWFKQWHQSVGFEPARVKFRPQTFQS